MPCTRDLPIDPKLTTNAYLQWAQYTRFRYFGTARKPLVVLLVKFAEPVGGDARIRLRKQGVWISDWYDGYTHTTVTVRSEKLPDGLQLLKSQGALCIELASPTGDANFFEGPTIEPVAGGPVTVLGIIDDGCPFAHLHFRSTNLMSLAVRFIWNQGAPSGSGSAGVPVPYGATFLDADLKALLNSATTAAGSIEEDTVYRSSGLPSLQGGTSHGAQVMSHASGNARHRRGPVALPYRSDMAFVQLPSEALDDPSGQWLHHYALDGVQAIRFYARQMFQPPAKRVIINLSYGPQTGPHDGSSIVETAIDEIMEKAAAEGCDLQVVLPSGNSHRLRTHAEFDLARNGGAVEWCVSPDSQVPSYLETWLPANVSMDDLDVALTCPTGERITAAYLKLITSDDETAAVIAAPACDNPAQIVIVMIIAPTARPLEPDPMAPPLAVPGRWKVEVSVLAGHSVTVPNPLAHAYLARIDPNLGRTRRGHSGYLDSPGYDPKRYLRESSQLDTAMPLASAEVTARGSMSGIATGRKAKVAAGYADSTKLPSLYSSGGPSRGPRVGPDWAYPTDDSEVLNGVLAGGNRSAAVTRLVGTSFAAPQLARELLEATLPAAPTSASPSPTWFKHRLGNGRR